MFPTVPPASHKLAFKMILSQWLFGVEFQKVPHLQKGSLGSMRCRDPGHVMFAQLWQSPPKESSDPMFIQDPCQP